MLESEIARAGWREWASSTDRETAADVMCAMPTKRRALWATPVGVRCMVHFLADMWLCVPRQGGWGWLAAWRWKPQKQMQRPSCSKLEVHTALPALKLHLIYALAAPAHAEVDVSLGGFSPRTTFRMSQALVPVITDMLRAQPKETALAVCSTTFGSLQSQLCRVCRHLDLV